MCRAALSAGVVFSATSENVSKSLDRRSNFPRLSLVYQRLVELDPKAHPMFIIRVTFALHLFSSITEFSFRISSPITYFIDTEFIGTAVDAVGARSSVAMSSSGES